MRIIDIIKDVEFTEANVAFRAALVQLKSIGKGRGTQPTKLQSQIRTWNYSIHRGFSIRILLKDYNERFGLS